MGCHPDGESNMLLVLLWSAAREGQREGFQPGEERRVTAQREGASTAESGRQTAMDAKRPSETRRAAWEKGCGVENDGCSGDGRRGKISPRACLWRKPRGCRRGGRHGATGRGSQRRERRAKGREGLARSRAGVRGTGGVGRGGGRGLATAARQIQSGCRAPSDGQLRPAREVECSVRVENARMLRVGLAGSGPGAAERALSRCLPCGYWIPATAPPVDCSRAERGRGRGRCIGGMRHRIHLRRVQDGVQPGVTYRGGCV